MMKKLMLSALLAIVPLAAFGEAKPLRVPDDEIYKECVRECKDPKNRKPTQTEAQCVIACAKGELAAGDAASEATQLTNPPPPSECADKWRRWWGAKHSDPEGTHGDDIAGLYQDWLDCTKAHKTTGDVGQPKAIKLDDDVIPPTPDDDHKRTLGQPK
jgi:hypothetical protein